MTAFDRIGPDTDRDAAVSELAETNYARKTARGEYADRDVSRAFAVARLSPAFAAADRGHVTAWDPPAGLTSVDARWTCQRCGAAVLRREGKLYGSALERDCNGYRN